MKKYGIPILWFLFLLLLSGCGGSSGQSNSSQMGGAIQGKSVQLTQMVSTIAGVSPGATDGIGSEARFYSPYGIVTDGTSLFVADRGNKTIRKIDIATRAVTTLAGSVDSTGFADGTGPAAGFLHPTDLTTDGSNLYVTDGPAIRKVVIASGTVTTIAGNATTSGVTDGVGSDARFSSSLTITSDGSNLFVADSGNYTIRKIVIATAEVTTIAGSPGSRGSADGMGAAARFGSLGGITTDGVNLFIADSSNGVIRKLVIATGEVSVVAVSSGDLVAGFSYPVGIATDGTNLFITDMLDRTIKKLVIATGIMTTVAGGAGNSGPTDGIGTAARFNLPFGITTDGTNLFVTDYYDETIRKIVVATGEVSTVAGTVSPGSIDGNGTSAKFSYPNALTTDGTNLYVADSSNYTVRKINITSGVVTTLAGTAKVLGTTDGTGATASFGHLNGITTDGKNLYVTEYDSHTIRKVVIATGEVSTLAGSAGISGSSDGTGAAARFTRPYGITTDGRNLYISDSGNHTIRKVVIATGAVTTLAGVAGTSGANDGIGVAAMFKSPYGLTTDGNNLFIADAGNNKIRKMVLASGAVTSLASTISGSSTPVARSLSSVITVTPVGPPPPVTTPIPSPTPILTPVTPSPVIPIFGNPPLDITTDGTNLFVTYYTWVRRVEIATGVMTDIAGNGRSGVQDGAGAAAKFGSLRGITTDGKKLYVTDSANSSIRRIQ